MNGRRLNPTLPHLKGETPTSFTSRLAQVHLAGNAGAKFFCADMGIDFRKVVDGQPDVLAALADVAGIDPTMLAAEAFRRVPEGHLFRGERFPKGSLVRTFPRFCPACLLDDCSGASQPEAMAYGRTIWSIAAIRTCPIHGMEITRADRTVDPSGHHDFAQLIKPLLPDLGAMVDRATHRSTSGFELYVLGRLGGENVSAPWLDGLPLHVGIAICEAIGMVDCFGRDVLARGLSDGQRAEAGKSGFRIASCGEAGIRDFMEELLRSYPYSRSATEGPQAVLGKFYKFLAFGAKHSDFDGVRSLVRDFMIKRMPFGPGDIIFGTPVQQRALHSVRSASLEMNVHPQRLRKVLHAAGVLSTEQMKLPYGNATFDAATAAQTLTDAVNGLFMAEIESYLGTGRSQTKVLVDFGIVKPMFPKRPDLDHLFRRRDLDKFLNDIFVDAVSVDDLDDDMADVQRAMRRVCCTTIEIVRLVLDRKLSWVGRQTGVHGFAALLVRVSEIRPIIRGSMDGWLTARTIETTMRSSTKVVRSLIERGYLKAEEIKSPLNRCPVKVIKQGTFDEFRLEYATLFEAMQDTGIHFRTIKKRLETIGVEPVIRREDVGAAFYRRSDLKRL